MNRTTTHTIILLVAIIAVLMGGWTGEDYWLAHHPVAPAHQTVKNNAQRRHPHA